MNEEVIKTQKIEVQLSEPLFEFSSHQQWVNKARSWYSNCGVPRGHYITIDSIGRICTKGGEFMRADRENTFPVTVYRMLLT